MLLPIKGYQNQNDVERDSLILATHNIKAIVKGQKEAGIPYLLWVEENDNSTARQILQGPATVNSSGIICQQCESRTATIRMTKFIESKQIESHYCQQCVPKTR